MNEKVRQLVEELFTDPRYLLQGEADRFGDKRLAFSEVCPLLSATGEPIGQLLLSREYRRRGRPDGERPHEQESLLDFYHDQLAQGHLPALAKEDAGALREESWLYYIRRNFFFQLGEYDNARADAEHNLGLLDLLQTYAVDEADKWSMARWWPWIERDRAIAAALTALEQEDLLTTASELYRAEKSIREFGEQHAERYAQEDADKLAPAMISHVARIAELLREEEGLPEAPEERLERAVEAGDAEEIERLRREMERELFEEP